MTPTRVLSLACRAIIFSAWALSLSLLGLWLLFAPPAELGALRPIFPSLGLAAFGAGQVLFMTMVADRLFPRASPRLVGSLEVLAGGALVSGLLGFAWMYTTGG